MYTAAVLSGVQPYGVPHWRSLTSYMGRCCGSARICVASLICARTGTQIQSDGAGP